MWNAFFTFLTTSSGKGWASSALLHLFAFGTLSIIYSGENEPQIVRFASAESSPITLVLRQVESDSDNTATDVRVEIQPLEARIEDRRYVHSSMTDDFEIELPDIETVLQLSDARLVRPLASDGLAQLIDTPIELPRRIERHVPMQLNSRVASLPVAETTLPEFGDNRPPNYPQSAISRGWEGTVLLRVHLSPDGSVTKVEVIDSSGFAVLDGAAVNAVKTWAATPATCGGKPVATTIRLPVKFRLPTR